MNNSNDPTGNRTPTFWLPVQCLNQLRHRVPQSPVGGQGIFSSPKSMQTSAGADLASSKEALSARGKAVGAWH